MEKSDYSALTTPLRPARPLAHQLALTPRHRRWFGGIALVLTVLLLAAVWPAMQQPGFATRLLAAIYGSSLGLLATLFGAVLVLALPRQVQQRWLDDALSVSGGMMLAAAIFSLLEPARLQLTAAQPELGLFNAQLLLALATLSGAALLAWLERWLPHSHPVAGDNAAAQRHQYPSAQPQGQNLQQHRMVSQRLWLFVLAIGLHNVPEGLAVGIGFAGPDLLLGSGVSLAIALQDVPEGFAMALVLQKLRLPLRQVLGWSLAAALLEPVGAVLASCIGQVLGQSLALAYPLLLALAAGAMLFVVLHEVMPEVQSAGRSSATHRSSLWLLTGFLLMWTLDSEAFLALWRS